MRAWQEPEGEHRDAAVLTPERPVPINGAVSDCFAGEAIAVGRAVALAAIGPGRASD